MRTATSSTWTLLSSPTNGTRTETRRTELIIANGLGLTPRGDTTHIFSLHIRCFSHSFSDSTWARDNSEDEGKVKGGGILSLNFTFRFLRGRVIKCGGIQFQFLTSSPLWQVERRVGTTREPSYSSLQGTTDCQARSQ